MWVFLLNFEEDPVVLLINFEGGLGVPLLNFRVVAAPGFQGPEVSSLGVLFPLLHHALRNGKSCKRGISQHLVTFY